MGFKNIMSGALKTVLPSIAGALPLPPPFGAMAAAQVGKILGVDNLKPEQVPDAIAAAQAKDPEIMLKLKQADQEFELHMKELGIESVEKLAEIDAADRASARGREVATKDYTNRIIAYAIVALTFTMEGYVLIKGPPPMIDGVIIGRIMATMENALILVLSYYFGSSHGSSIKTDILAAVQGKQP